jgi:hypothetical protein
MVSEQTGRRIYSWCLDRGGEVVPTPGTTRTALRIEPSLWQRFGEVAANRSEVLRDFIRWYIGEKGAKMPKRPTLD